MCESVNKMIEFDIMERSHILRITIVRFIHNIKFLLLDEIKMNLTIQMSRSRFTFTKEKVTVEI